MAKKRQWRNNDEKKSHWNNDAAARSPHLCCLFARVCRWVLDVCGRASGRRGADGRRRRYERLPPSRCRVAFVGSIFSAFLTPDAVTHVDNTTCVLVERVCRTTAFGALLACLTCDRKHAAQAVIYRFYRSSVHTFEHWLLPDIATRVTAWLWFGCRGRLQRVLAASR